MPFWLWHLSSLNATFSGGSGVSWEELQEIIEHEQHQEVRCRPHPSVSHHLHIIQTLCQFVAQLRLTRLNLELFEKKISMYIIMKRVRYDWPLFFFSSSENDPGWSYITDRQTEAENKERKAAGCYVSTLNPRKYGQCVTSGGNFGD